MREIDLSFPHTQSIGASLDGAASKIYLESIHFPSSLLQPLEYTMSLFAWCMHFTICNYLSSFIYLLPVSQIIVSVPRGQQPCLSWLPLCPQDPAQCLMLVKYLLNKWFLSF